MKRDDQLMKSAGRASAIGWELALSIVGGMLAGWWGDSKLGTEPWLMVLGLTIGSFAGFRALFRLAKRMNEDDEDQQGQG